MARFDLNLLSALNALLSEKNVTRAAERLFVTQPTMSGMLQRLRYQFDDQLLVRNGRELEHTPFGASLVEPVQEALRSIELLIHTEPFFDAATSEHEFTVMASNYCASIFLPHLVAQLAGQAPGIRLVTQPINNPLERIYAGQADICITADDMSLLCGGTNPEKIHAEPLFRDEFVCVVAADHPLTRKASLDQLFSYPHVGVHMFGTVNTIESAWIEEHRPGYRPSVVVADFPLVAPMVAHSTLVGVMPARMAELSARAMKIRSFQPPYAMPPLVEAMMWHSRHQNDPAHIWLRAAIRQTAAEWLERDGETPLLSDQLEEHRPRRHATIHSIR
ncbi:LysR family transcriptional regulator [Sphingobium phenoxybenzoativorans]|uniref:LysR family transcriptional regulator n=1 Tax=Sphingobium phenoxybenzoativorans TaxID=1592790 RepID=UPI0008720030|nr:LysR family transcriptional regulator [Sphingobium phenoxybenzoativorans]